MPSLHPGGRCSFLRFPLVAHIEYDGIRQNLDHLAPSDQRAAIRLANLYIDAGMRPPSLSVISAGEDVTKDPDRWSPNIKRYTGPGCLEILDPAR